MKRGIYLQKQWKCDICGAIGKGELNGRKHPRIACCKEIVKMFGSTSKEKMKFEAEYGSNGN